MRLEGLVNKVSEMIVFTIPLATIIGWKTDNYQLTSWFLDSVPMQFNTALCFFIIGTHIYIRDVWKDSKSILCLSLIISGVTFIWEFLPNELFLDNLFHNHSGYSVDTPNPGRMSPITALSIIAISIFGLLQKKGGAFLIILFSLPPFLGHTIKWITGITVTGLFTIPHTETTFMAFSTASWCLFFVINVFTRRIKL